MSDQCNHDLGEQDTAVADGICPLCASAALREQGQTLTTVRENLYKANTRAECAEAREKDQGDNAEREIRRLSAVGCEQGQEIERLQHGMNKDQARINTLTAQLADAIETLRTIVFEYQPTAADVPQVIANRIDLARACLARIEGKT